MNRERLPSDADHEACGDRGFTPWEYTECLDEAGLLPPASAFHPCVKCGWPTMTTYCQGCDREEWEHFNAGPTTIKKDES